MPRKPIQEEKKHTKLNVCCSVEMQQRLADYIESQMWKPSVSQVVQKAIDDFLKSQGF